MAELMSVRYEWMGASSVTIDVAPKGTEVGADFVDEEFALILSSDEAVVIEGSAQELEILLTRCLQQIEYAKQRQRSGSRPQ
jgi:hypothetical protein